jgi:hypothetical protein
MGFIASGRSSAGRLAAAAAALMVVWMPAWAETADQGNQETVPAAWTPKELRFVYMGFTSHYSCDGLRDRMRYVLQALGARKDMQLTESPCSDLGRPTKFPGVYLKIHVLQPADQQTDADVKPVAAHWETVDISRISGTLDPLQDAGHCELVEQIKHSVLPLFTTRNVQFHSSCVPNQLSVAPVTLTAEVLVTDQSEKKAAAK